MQHYKIIYIVLLNINLIYYEKFLQCDMNKQNMLNELK